jgi:UDP-glucose 4-epimerase
MRAVVLGGNGFIGSHLVDELRRHGHHVRVFDRHPERYRRPVGGVEYVFGDFGERGHVSDALDTMDVVYDFIGTALPSASNEDPTRDVEVSVLRTLTLLEECVAKRVKKVVYISSGGTIYGVPRALPVAEDSPNWPICSYGVTRLCVEKYLELFRHLYGLRYVTIRPSNAFGPRQDPEGVQGVISVFLGQIINGLGITIWGDGSVVRDYIYVQDLVEGIYAASIADSEHRVFNLGSGVGITLNELVDVICERAGRRTTIDYAPDRAFDVPAIYLDITRAREELGWRPTTQLGGGIDLTLAFLRSELGGTTLTELRDARSRAALVS